MLPEKFKFLEEIGTLPRMISTGIQLLGIREVKGVKDNPIIMDWAKRLGVNGIYTSDDKMAWCSLAQCYVCKISDKPMPFTGYEVLRAKSFLSWGSKVPKGQEMLGDILVISRSGGYHVCMYIGESKKSFFCMGGNQGDSYSIVEIEKDRVLEARRYYKTSPPASVRKYILDSTGKFSTNEA
jgi:uncharacterized protein (TIGR02594 family)